MQRQKIEMKGTGNKSGKRKPPSGHPIIASLILAGAVCLLTAGIAHTPWFSSAELQGYDLLTARAGAAKPSENIVVVDFDEAAVRSYKAFPIPRDLLSRVVAKISAGEPAVIGLDVLLEKITNLQRPSIMREMWCWSRNMASAMFLRAPLCLDFAVRRLVWRSGIFPGMRMG